MPQIEAGTTIEEMYWQRVRETDPVERMRGSFAMFQSYYNKMLRELKKERPEAKERELRIALAKRLYGADPRTMKLIAMAEADEKRSGGL